MKSIKSKFRNAILLSCFCLLSFTSFGQTNDIKKISAILEKNLIGNYFLRSIYDPNPPCYGIGKIAIKESGEVAITGSENGCNITFTIKDATIIKYDTKRLKIRIYQKSPAIDITFLLKENEAIVYQAFEDLKMIANK